MATLNKGIYPADNPADNPADDRMQVRTADRNADSEKTAKQRRAVTSFKTKTLALFLLTEIDEIRRATSSTIDQVLIAPYLTSR